MRSLRVNTLIFYYSLLIKFSCGGVLASMTSQPFGLIDNWLVRLKDIYRLNRDRLDKIEDWKTKSDLLCELNVIGSIEGFYFRSVFKPSLSSLALCASSVIQSAWHKKQELSIHGWCYRITDGLIRDLHVCVNGLDQIDKLYRFFEDDQTTAEKA